MTGFVKIPVQQDMKFKVHIMMGLPGLPCILHFKIYIAQPCHCASQQGHFQKQQQDAKTQLSLETTPGILKRTTCRKVTLHCACHEIKHRHVQSLAPATESAHRSKAASISFTCHEKSTLDHQKRRFSLHLPRKVTTKSEHGHSTTTTRAQSRRAPARAQPILRACAVEMHFEDLQVNEC